MRYLASLADEPTARRFADYLHTQGIATSVEAEQSGDAWAVWVVDDDHLDAARRALGEFQQSPDDARYQQATKTAATLRRQQEKVQTRRRTRVVDVRTHWHILSQPKFGLTIMLIVLCGVAAALTKLGQDDTANGYLMMASEWDGTLRGGLSQILHGEIWRVITPIFLHFGPLHLIFNLIWLRDLGTMIETRRGPLFLGGLVLAAGLIANFVQYAWAGPFHGGMSGVIYALFGYAWIMGRIAPHRGMGVAQSTRTIMLAWLVLCMTGWLGPIGNAAHVAGLVVGVVAAYAPHLWRKLRT